VIFLIEYDRPKGIVIKLDSYKDSQRADAERARLQIELQLNEQAIDHEVVLLDAASLAALKKTHRRYFQTTNQIGQSIG
jgi:hypothetical protein